MVSSTVGVSVTDAAPEAEAATTASSPPFRVSLEQALGGSLWAEEPPRPEVVGDMTLVDRGEMAAVTVGDPGLVAGGIVHGTDAEADDAAVWTSPDSRAWQRVRDDAGVFGEAMSVTGTDSDQIINDVAGGSFGLIGRR